MSTPSVADLRALLIAGQDLALARANTTVVAVFGAVARAKSAADVRELGARLAEHAKFGMAEEAMIRRAEAAGLGADRMTEALRLREETQRTMVRFYVTVLDTISKEHPGWLDSVGRSARTALKCAGLKAL